MVFTALRAHGRDPAAHLALEEALLSLPGDAGPLLVLYVNDPCVIIGRNQNPWAEAAPGSGLPVLRRVSGGGAVYHDAGNLNWALFVPRARHDPAAELALVAAALRRLGIASETSSRGGLFLASASPRAGGKISGTARRFGPERVLHHGTILVDADLERLRSSLGGLRLRSSRAIASVPATPVNLSSLSGDLSVELLARTLVEELGQGGEAEDAEEYLGARGAQGRALEARRRHASWDWTWGETPAFSFALEGPRGELLLDVRCGIVSAVSGSPAAAPALLGRRFDYDLSAELAGAKV